MDGEGKLNTCVHRSNETYERKVKICCNRFQDVIAYDCELREIFPLTVSHCENCEVYKEKY